MNHFNHSHFSTEEESVKSKTAQKKAMLALQDLGKALTDLNDSQLAQIPLNADLSEAIHQARRLKQREARRRQLQYVGKLMRVADYQAIAEAYQKLIDKNKLHTQRQHRVEHWRDRLIEEGKGAQSEFLRLYPQADSQHLRQLIRLALKEKQENTPPAQARKLFRYILQVLKEE